MNDFDIVETYHSSGVIKYVHANGMETTLKTVPTCGEQRDKAVLFISSSVGCNQGCEFCYLTAKKMKCVAVDEDMVINCCKQVLKRAQIDDKYLKLSFMGMGEWFATDLDIFNITRELFNYCIYELDNIAGIDGVDIGTSLPKQAAQSKLIEIATVDLLLQGYKSFGIKFNPNNNDRTLVRLFVSLHSTQNEKRSRLMPNTMSIEQMNRYLYGFKSDIIFHYMLLDGINDSLKDVSDLYAFIESSDKELRLLRFNKCPGVMLDESGYVDEIIDLLKRSRMKFKYQISAGSVIKAACGQFLCKEGGNERKKG